MQRLVKERTALNLDLSRVKNQTLRGKLTLAGDALEDVINYPVFKHAVKEHRYNYKQAFADAEDHPEEVYFKIMEGAEVLDPRQDYEWDIKVIPYYSRWSKAVGYTYANRNEIWVNTKYYLAHDFTIAEIAENLAHEYMHKLGYGHSYKYNTNWPWTVPYAVGGIVNNLVRKHKLIKYGVPSHTSFKKMGFFKRVWFGLVNMF